MSATIESGVPAGTDEVVNVEALLAPIPGDNPAGESLQYAGLHDEIREARRADEQLAQGEWRREHKLADWGRVVELTSDALATRTKDLQIGAWLAEALVQVHGSAGLRAGLKLVHGLEVNFWAELYPEIDEGDLEARANALAWLDRQLALALKRIPLTDGAGGLRYAYHHWLDSQAFDIPADLNDLDAAELERFAAVRAQAADEGKITSEQWRVAKATTGRQFYEKLMAVLDDCWTEFQALDSATDQLFGAETPGLRLLQHALEDVRALLGKIVLEKRALEPDVDSEDDPGQPAAGDGQAAPARRQFTSGGVVTSREQAYQKLAEAAAYFRAAEPHSPVAYLVERAIRWGQMPLELWLAEVVKSEDVLLNLRETLGLKHVASTEPGYPSDDDNQ